MAEKKTTTKKTTKKKEAFEKLQTTFNAEDLSVLVKDGEIENVYNANN